MTRFAFVADDFTGATDALWQFRRFGLTGSLVTDVAWISPSDDVVGIATTARAAADPVAVALPLLTELARLGPQILQYKICSTFDSAPSVGSIGAVIAAAHRTGLARGPVPVVAAQPELGRYTSFATHFVRVGDSVERLDRYPPMRDHPVTPASEADLRVRLAEQGAGRVGWLPARASAREFREPAGYAALVADATTSADLRALGDLLLAELRDGPHLCVGSGGLSYALASSLGCAERPGRRLDPVAPVLVVSGSRSPITLRQIEVAERAGWRVLDGPAGAKESLRAGRHTIVQTTRGPARDPGDVGKLLGAVARSAVRAGLVRRLVVAGGDTSGQVVSALGARSLSVVAELAPGGPVCVLTSGDPACDGLEVALKGGQVGGDDFLLRAADRESP